MGKAGKKYALRTHLWENKIEQMMELYSKYTK
jgi:hypothetical protein